MTSSSSSSASVSSKINNFSSRLFSELAKQNENFVFSPLSIHVALSMCFAGASNQNYNEMKNILFEDMFSNDRQTSLSPILAEMKKLISSYLQSNGEGSVIKLANAMFTRSDFSFCSEYVNNVTSTFSARAVNELSAEAINKFAEEATEKIICEVVTPAMITPTVVAALVNAIYFKGTWAHQFNKKKTNEKGVFYKFDKTKITAPMMKMESVQFKDVLYGTHSWANNTKFQSLSLPYVGNKFSMVFLLPNEATKEAFEKLSKQVCTKGQLLSKLRSEQYSVKLDTIQIPRFKLEFGTSLNEYLQDIGMKKMFVAGGLQHMTGTIDDLRVGQVIHKAFLEVNEEGTTAAAVTVVLIERECKSIPHKFILDRPFICLLKHEETGTIAFAAQVTSL